MKCEHCNRGTVSLKDARCAACGGTVCVSCDSRDCSNSVRRRDDWRDATPREIAGAINPDSGITLENYGLRGAVSALAMRVAEQQAGGDELRGKFDSFAKETATHGAFCRRKIEAANDAFEKWVHKACSLENRLADVESRALIAGVVRVGEKMSDSIQPAPLLQRTASLASGGTVRLELRGDFLQLSADDREFVEDLLRLFDTRIEKP